VWVDNQSTTNTYGIKVSWAQYDVSGVQETGGVISPGQVAPYLLGGASGCAAVYAYVLQVFWQGVLQGSTGVIRPDASDGAPCADGWGIG
jgi:hypothetical protein